MHLAALHLYPVKSCRGLHVTSAELDDLGLVGDRRFLVVDDSGQFITQRTHPRLALITTALSATHLTLSAESVGPITVALASDPRAPLRPVTVWKSTDLLAEDCGNDVAHWLSDFLRHPLRLVRIGEQFHRPVLKKAAQPGDCVSFADAAPLLVISEASLTALNDRIQENGGEPVPVDRFRPNLVIANCPAFAEDTWSRLQIGDTVLRSAGPSERCIMTTTDQVTGERNGPEPLRTLATFRRAPGNPTAVCFGTNFINESKRGTLRVGTEVERVDPNAFFPAHP